MKPESRIVSAGVGEDSAHGAVMPPITLSANFTFAGFDKKREYDYTRSGNPTRQLLSNTLSELEGGAGAAVTGSGMSAVALALQLVPAGGRLVAAHDCYGGTHRLLCAWAGQRRFRLEFRDLTDAATVQELADDPPALTWAETPSNPLLRITDIGELATALAGRGLLVVDNTFLSPLLQQPLALGADLVVHSTTKLINGHSDVVGGAVIARDAEIGERVKWWANCLGLNGAPFDAYLTQRGLRTLAARVAQQQQNAQKIVATLVDHPAVRRVHYPGLPDHPGHATARRQQSGFGTLISFEPHGGAEAAAYISTSLRWFALAESLGGVESLISHPATMTHAAMQPAARRSAGISDGLLRLSVGLEHPDDLTADLIAALETFATVSS